MTPWPYSRTSPADKSPSRARSPGPSCDTVSHSIWLLRFDHGKPAPLDIEAFRAVTRPYVATRESDHGFLGLRMPDRGEAEVYAALEPDGTLGSVLLTHFSAGAFLGLVADLAIVLGAAIVLQDGVALIANTEQHNHLVSELRHAAVIIELDGAAIQNVIDRL